MVVAEFSVTPVIGENLRPYVDAAIEVVKKSGLNYEVDAMSTTVEGELDQVLDVVKKAHRAVMGMGAGRVLTEIRIDEREIGVSMEEELEGYRAAI
jgi:uncharacterized protein (TIGR00106 family)